MILIRDKAMHIHSGYAGNVYSGCLPSANMIVAKKQRIVGDDIEIDDAGDGGGIWRYRGVGKSRG